MRPKPGWPATDGVACGGGAGNTRSATCRQGIRWGLAFLKPLISRKMKGLGSEAVFLTCVPAPDQGAPVLLRAEGGSGPQYHMSAIDSLRRAMKSSSASSVA